MVKKNSAVDQYIEDAAEFSRPMLKRLRSSFHKGCPKLEETIKWGIPCFEYQGILGSMAAFKQHVAVGFWKSKEMKDPAKILQRRAASMCNIQFKVLKDMPTIAVLVDYVAQAAELNERTVGKPRTKTKVVVPKIPKLFGDALRKNQQAKRIFDRFAPGQRRDYIEWIVEAKRESTREKRVLQAIEWISEGKTRNWKYETKR